MVEPRYLKKVPSLTDDSVAFHGQLRTTRQTLIGSSRGHGAEATSVASEILSPMLGHAREYPLGQGELSTIRTRTGFRAATPSRVFHIDPWLEDKIIFLAARYAGFGSATAPGADQPTGTKSRIPIEPYLPETIAAERIHA